MAGMRSVSLLNLEFTYKYGQMRTFYLKKKSQVQPIIHMYNAAYEQLQTVKL